MPEVVTRIMEEQTVVDDLTNESFQTGKAIVSIGTELIQAIVKACRESEQNKALTREDKDTG